MQIEELYEEAHLESKTIEYKGILEEGTGKNGKRLEIGWLKTIVAFANTEGGTLFVGVEDKTHKIVALEHSLADKIILMVHRQIRERVDPIIDYNISSIPIKGMDGTRFVLRIEVHSNKNLPVVLHENGMLGIYVRNCGRTDLATQEQIRDLVLMSDNTPFDSALTNQPYVNRDGSH